MPHGGARQFIQELPGVATMVEAPRERSEEAARDFRERQSRGGKSDLPHFL